MAHTATTTEPVLMIDGPFCINCGTRENSLGRCVFNCQARFNQSCMDCGMATTKPYFGDHKGMTFCPGFRPLASEWADGYDDPRYQAEVKAWHEASRRARAEFSDAHRAARAAEYQEEAEAIAENERRDAEFDAWLEEHRDCPDGSPCTVEGYRGPGW